MIVESTNHFDWVPFYREFAEKLLGYKNRRKELCVLVHKIFEKAGVKEPKLEADGFELTDIDPFTVFGLFNKSSMTDDNRKRIIAAVAELFNVTAPQPASYIVPTLNNMSATYYWFKDKSLRGEHDIDDLWLLFDAAISYAKKQTSDEKERFVKNFDLMIVKPGIANSKLTMALFWIAPDTYLNLDSRSLWYIYESGRLPQKVVEALPSVTSKITAEQYLEITEKIAAYLRSDASPLHDFKQLSYAAWEYSEYINQQKDNVEKEKGNGSSIGDEQVRSVHYWLYSPGDSADHWDEFYEAGIIAIGWRKLGDLSIYQNKNEITQKLKATYDADKSYTHNANTTWQFAHEMEPGDIVFVKKGRKLIIGQGIVQSDYFYEPERESYPNVRKVEWNTPKSLELPYPGNAPMKTLTDITDYTEIVEKIKELFEEDDAPQAVVQQYENYDKTAFLDDVYMSSERYDVLKRLLEKKKNIIIQGAPGVGKTFAAKRLAYSIIGEKNQDRVTMVQFHQSYSYEDFIMGFRPIGNGFELRNGVFYEFCKKAEIDSDNPYFFIIDEINRGNLSKILGELFMLIENDKRGIKLRLLYSNEQFSVPKNVYIIGLMNTADRSLAMLDYALRRRFAFFELEPGFETVGFKKYQQTLNNKQFNDLIACVKELNSAIKDDDNLGSGFCIGHSYFCNLKEITVETLSDIIDTELIPLLKEYWFDEPDKVKEWSDKLRKAIQ